MLLNLSNHPIQQWSENQVNVAIEKYAQIHDLAFPNIDPSLSSEELDKEVLIYIDIIDKLKPTAVHIMGELTFTYRLVGQLRSKGMQCIASTTVRDVSITENVKSVRFQFVQFREY